MAKIQISKPTNFEYNTNNQDSSFDYYNVITTNNECELPIPFTDKQCKWVGNKYTKTSKYTDKDLFTITDSNSSIITTKVPDKKAIPITNSYIKNNNAVISIQFSNDVSSSNLYEYKNNQYEKASSLSLAKSYEKLASNGTDVTNSLFTTNYISNGLSFQNSLSGLNDIYNSISNFMSSDRYIIYELSDFSESDDFTFLNNEKIKCPNWSYKDLSQTSIVNPGHTYLIATKYDDTYIDNTWCFFASGGKLYYCDTVSITYFKSSSKLPTFRGVIITIKPNLFKESTFRTYWDSIDLNNISSNDKFYQWTSSNTTSINTYSASNRTDTLYKGTFNSTGNNTVLTTSDYLDLRANTYYTFTGISTVSGANNADIYQYNNGAYKTVSVENVLLNGSYYIQNGVEYDIGDLYKISSGDISSSNYILLSPEEEINRLTRRQKKAPHGAFFVAYRFFTVLRR